MALTIPKSLKWGKSKAKTPVKPSKPVKAKPTTAKTKKTATKPKSVAVKPKKQTVKATAKPVKPSKPVKAKPTTAKTKKTAVKPVSAVPKAIKPTKTTEIRVWYHTAYPTDTEWEAIRPRITFADVMDCLKAGEDFYTFVGDDVDSLIRERIFELLASMYGVPYKEIYDMWLDGGKKPKYVPPTPQNPGMKELKKLRDSSDFTKDHIIIATVPKQDAGKAQPKAAAVPVAKPKAKAKRKSGYDFGPHVKGEITGAEFKAIADNMSIYRNTVPVNKKVTNVVDPAHVMMGQYKSKDDYSIFGLPSKDTEEEIYVDSKALSDAAKKIDAKKTYKVSKDKENYILTSGSEVHKVPLKDGLSARRPNLDESMDIEAVLYSDELSKAVKRSKVVSDHLALDTEKGDIFVMAQTPDGNGSCVDMRVRVGGAVDGHGVAMYPNDYMGSIAKHFKKDGSMKVKYSKDFPLSIKSDRGNYEAEVLLAPRVE